MERVRRVLDSYHARISNAVKSSLPDFAEKLFEKGLIAEAVKNEPGNYNKIINNFKAYLALLKDAELKSTLEQFLDCLRDLGGAPAKAADILKKELEEALVESAVLCMCGERAIKRRSKKENKNKGMLLINFLLM